jgi:hypothetical protein
MLPASFSSRGHPCPRCFARSRPFGGILPPLGLSRTFAFGFASAGVNNRVRSAARSSGPGRPARILRSIAAASMPPLQSQPTASPPYPHRHARPTIARNHPTAGLSFRGQKTTPEKTPSENARSEQAHSIAHPRPTFAHPNIALTKVPATRYNPKRGSGLRAEPVSGGRSLARSLAPTAIDANPRSRLCYRHQDVDTRMSNALCRDLEGLGPDTRNRGRQRCLTVVGLKTFRRNPPPPIFPPHGDHNKTRASAQTRARDFCPTRRRKPPLLPNTVSYVRSRVGKRAMKPKETRTRETKNAHLVQPTATRRQAHRL